jgi:hypothetical protein
MCALQSSQLRNEAVKRIAGKFTLDVFNVFVCFRLCQSVCMCSACHSRHGAAVSHETKLLNVLQVSYAFTLTFTFFLKVFNHVRSLIFISLTTLSAHISHLSARTRSLIIGCCRSSHGPFVRIVNHIHLLTQFVGVSNTLSNTPPSSHTFRFLLHRLLPTVT